LVEERLGWKLSDGKVAGWWRREVREAEWGKEPEVGRLT
jgi:hypothetical protein